MLIIQKGRERQELDPRTCTALRPPRIPLGAHAVVGMGCCGVTSTVTPTDWILGVSTDNMRDVRERHSVCLHGNNNNYYYYYLWNSLTMPLLAERWEEKYIFRTQSLQIGKFVEDTRVPSSSSVHTLVFLLPGLHFFFPQVWANRWAVPSGFSFDRAVRVRHRFCVYLERVTETSPSWNTLCEKTASGEHLLCPTQLLRYFSMPTSPLALLPHLLRSDKQLSLLYLVWLRAQEESRNSLKYVEWGIKFILFPLHTI